MTRMLVAYGTGEGQTAKVAVEIGDRLRRGGAEVEVVDLAHAQPAPFGFDAVVIGGSVHAGKFQSEVREYLAGYASALNRQGAWFFGVSMSEAGLGQQMNHARALEQIDELLHETGFKPREALSIAGALKYRDYNFFKRAMMKHIAVGQGGPGDTSRNWEYTDWAKVAGFADRIAAEVARPASVG